jgi:hypothetical protein
VVSTIVFVPFVALLLEDQKVAGVGVVWMSNLLLLLLLL